MEPVHPAARNNSLPPPAPVPAAAAPDPAAAVPAAGAAAPGPAAPGPAAPPATTARTSDPTADAVRKRSSVAVSLRSMLPWRIGGAVALSTAFVLIGWQVQRLIDDQPWSDTIMLMSIAAGATAAACVLGWTWMAATNARRLVGPASNRPLPDPKRAVASWFVPLAFVGVAVAVVAYLGERASNTSDNTVSSIPLAVAVLCLLLAIPMTYRPLYYLSNMVRQVGGHSAKLAQWMWVPVVLAMVGIGSIVALRVGGAVSDSSDASGGATEWAPLWVVGVVAIAPCVIVVLLAWRAASSVEEAIVLAFERRRPGFAAAHNGSGRPTSKRRLLPARSHPAASHANRGRARLIPGVDLVRLCIVTSLAGLALLTVVGAAVMFMFWSAADDGVLLPSQRARAWDAFGILHSAARVVGFVLVALGAIWTFLAVANVRLASGRRRNPVIAALAWPLAAIAFWIIADRLVIDGSVGSIVLGFALQALVLYVPFALLERSADAVDARRTPLRITFMFSVVLLVYIQALGGLSTIEETAVTSNYGRLAGFLAVGALIQLLSTLAVTEACSTIEKATDREAEHHNALVDQRERVAGRAIPQAQRRPLTSSGPAPAASAADPATAGTTTGTTTGPTTGTAPAATPASMGSSS